MSKLALKEKLEEKLYQNEILESEMIEEPNNIVPFLKPEQQLCSVVPDFAISLNEAKERIRILQEFVNEMMISGVDYGIIPNCNKPSLLKAGAEKLCDIFGFSKQIEIINRLEDWKEGIFHYEVKAKLINKRTGMLEAEGVGSCNTKEKKYLNQHAYSVINTVLKMAKKRALIDAVLSATRSSSIFTQDIEDMDIIEIPQSLSSSNKNVTASQPNKNSIPSNNAIVSSPAQKPATKSQLNKIQSLVTDKNIPVNKIKILMKERYDVLESRNLSLKNADDFIKHLINNY